MTYTTRFTQYARLVHNTTPDAAPRPNHNHTPFTIWIRQRWREWKQLNAHTGPITKSDHAAFDSWLESLPSTKEPA